MTETKWLEETDIHEMLEFSNPSDRKRRLFSVACCKRILHLMTDPRSLTAVEVAERYADKKATRKELQKAYNAANAAANAAARAAAYAAAYAANAAANAVYAANATADTSQNWNESFDQERQHQANLLREIVNPFKTKTKLNAEVKNLAEHVYLSQQDHQILADYLEEHYNEPELTTHLRQPNHLKGCWAVDLLKD